MERITPRHKRFVEQFCAHFEGARAAREAGYAESRAKQTAYDLLQDPDIKAMVEERLDELSMSAAEATKRHSDIARSDIGDFFYLEEDKEGNHYMVLDQKKVVEEGGGLIKEISWDRNGNPKIKLYDAKDAQKTIMDAHGVFNHKREVEHSGGLDIKGVDFADD